MKEYLQKLVRKQNLTTAETSAVGELFATGQLPEAEAAAFLMGLALKGETAAEIMGLAQALRTRLIPVAGGAVAIDTCGTGGDGAHTLNASTLSALVCAAAGVPVAKHGNRAISSRCGSFDLLEALGVNFQLTPRQAEECLRRTNLTFLFAPNFHPAFKHIMPIRQALGIRTIFNFLGPLLNPAGVRRQVIGVSVPGLAEKLGEALMGLGSERVLIITSRDGLDEVSVAAPTDVYEFTPGNQTRHTVLEPGAYYPLADIVGSDPAANAERSGRILAGAGTPAENEFVALNAGLALYAAGVAPNYLAGRNQALEILRSGAAGKKLAELVMVTNQLVT